MLLLGRQRSGAKGVPDGANNSVNRAGDDAAGDALREDGSGPPEGLAGIDAPG